MALCRVIQLSRSYHIIAPGATAYAVSATFRVEPRSAAATSFM